MGYKFPLFYFVQELEDPQQPTPVCSCELDSENSDTAAGTCQDGTCYDVDSTDPKDPVALTSLCQDDVSWSATPEPVVDTAVDSAADPVSSDPHQLHQDSDETNEAEVDKNVSTDLRNSSDCHQDTVNSCPESSPVQQESSSIPCSPEKTETSNTEATNCSISENKDREGVSAESTADSNNCSSTVAGMDEREVIPDACVVKEPEDEDNEEDVDEIICRLGEETSSMHSATEELSNSSPAHNKIIEPTEKLQTFEEVPLSKAEEDSDSIVTPESHEEFVPVTPTQIKSDVLVNSESMSVPNALSLSTVSDSVPSDSGVSGVTPTEDVSTPGDTDTGEY